MRYEPSAITFDVADSNALAQYLITELRSIAAALIEVDAILLPVLNVEPDKPRDGQIILVDGTNFNPGGTGAGFYGRSAGAWVKLG